LLAIRLQIQSQHCRTMPLLSNYPCGPKKSRYRRCGIRVWKPTLCIAGCGSWYSLSAGKRCRCKTASVGSSPALADRALHIHPTQARCWMLLTVAPLQRIFNRYISDRHQPKGHACCTCPSPKYRWPIWHVSRLPDLLASGPPQPRVPHLAKAQSPRRRHRRR